MWEVKELPPFQEGQQLKWALIFKGLVSMAEGKSHSKLQTI